MTKPKRTLDDALSDLYLRGMSEKEKEIDALMEGNVRGAYLHLPISSVTDETKQEVIQWFIEGVIGEDEDIESIRIARLKNIKKHDSADVTSFDKAIERAEWQNVLRGEIRQKLKEEGWKSNE